MNEAIRVGKLLEENKYAYFEEPVTYDDLEAIKRVADALTIPISNGEQDESFVNFRWLLAHDGLENVQPALWVTLRCENAWEDSRRRA